MVTTDVLYIYMDEIDASIMDNSLELISSPNLIDIIDLTKESPPGSVRHSRSHQINAEGVSSNRNITHGSNHRCRRPLSPIVLGNTGNTQINPEQASKVSHTTSKNEILTLDDTKEDNKDDDNKACFIVESDNKEPIPLTCPVCFEVLTSKRKPITTRCGHLFCTECLESFIGISKKCPTCKTSITLKSCIRLYF